MIDPLAPYQDVVHGRLRALATACAHAGDEPRPRKSGGSAFERALEPPIVLSNAYAFDSADEAAAAFRGDLDVPIYTRWGNPGIQAAERALASLEGAEAACLTASGMAAITGTLLALAGAGSHVVAPRNMYGESARLLRERLPRHGVTTTFVDDVRADGYAAAIRPDTRILYIETPANPRLSLADIAAIDALAKSRGLVTLVDSTFATPFAQTPLAHGADLVLHSATKALSGHGDVVLGAVLGRKDLVSVVRDLVVKGIGAVPSPFSAYLLLRGLRTLAIRQAQTNVTAAALAARLAADPRVARVFHPSLPDSPDHALACRQMFAFGSVLAFELAGDGKSALAKGKRFLDALRVGTHAVSLGDARTLVTHPASTTHSTMPTEDRALAGISDALVRVSVGLEDEDDLWKDFSAALGA